MEGQVEPALEYYDDETKIGLRAGLSRSELVHNATALSAEGALDVWTLPVLMNMALAPVTAPTTPTSGILTRLWTCVRGMTANNAKSATFYWGDANDKIYQSAFTMLTELGWGADAEGTDAGMQSFEAFGQTITPLGTVPAMPALGQAPLLIGVKMQLWIDTASAWGTTEVTGRVAGAKVTIPTGHKPKYVAVGPAGGVTYTRVGLESSTPELTIKLDKVDETELNHALNATAVKVRVRWNGPVIETVTGPLTYYNYVDCDMYGKLRFDGWEDVAGTNRAVSLTLRGEYNTTLASDIVARVQNTKATL